MSIGKLFIYILIGLFFICPLNGKGQSESQSDTAVELNFFWWGSEPRHEATLRAVEAYNESQSSCQIQVEYQDWAGYYEKITTRLAVGSAPDVFQFLKIWVNEYRNDKELFYDLRSLDEINLDNWSDSALAMSSIGDSVIGAPLGQNARILIYNKEITDRFPIDPSEYFTWEGFADIVKTVRDTDPELIGYSGNLDQLYYVLMAYLVQVSGKPFITEDMEFGFNWEELSNGLELLIQWFGNGTFQSLSRINLLDSAWTDPAWLNKKVVFSETPVTRLSQHSNYDFPIGLTRYWMKDGAVLSGNPVGSNLMFSISGRTGFPKESAAFLNYILESEDGVKLMGLQRGVPSNSKAFTILEEAGNIDNLTKEALKILNDSDIGVYSYLELNSIRELLSETIQLAGFGDKNPDDAARDFIDSGNKILSSYR